MGAIPRGWNSTRFTLPTWDLIYDEWLTLLARRIYHPPRLIINLFMGYRDSMTIIEGPNGYSIGLVDDTMYNPDSSDNAVAYGRFYSEMPYKDYNFPTRHGISLFKDGEVEKSVCICSSGGPTHIHARSSVLQDKRLLICCADSVFCLAFPALDLNWVTKADQATCFGIFEHRDGYILHGELEISRLDKDGRIIWQFSGPDIFTTLTGRDDFQLNGDVIEASTWDGTTFRIDAQTGQEL